MSTPLLLDTNLISELTRPSPRGRGLSTLAERDGEIAISSVTDFEHFNSLLVEDWSR